MYTTLKIRLRVKGEAKVFLLSYEQLYHKELELIARQMEHRKKRYSILKYDARIHTKNYWFLHQLALKKYHAEVRKSKFTYSRSSSWARGTFLMQEKVLTLFFGIACEIHTLHVDTAMDDLEQALLATKKIMRIDIVHDEKFWYANMILFHKNK